MRRVLACWSVLLVCGPLSAASRSPDTRSSGPPLSRAEAEAFALQLKTTLDLMTRQYARPVPRSDLVTAALRGLYAAVGASVPPFLPADVKKADAADNQLVELITRSRQLLGNRPALQGSKALEAALWAALKSLDPYGFLTTREAYRRTTEQARDGVGLELEEDGSQGPLRVKTVVPGGPAQKAGIRPGDLITHLDGQSLAGKPGGEARALWRRLTRSGRAHSFRLALVRRGLKSPRRLTLQPGPFKAETVTGIERDRDSRWNYFLDAKEGIAHVRVGALKYGTAEDLQQVLEALQRAGVRGLILDLRWCPGGMLSEAVDVAALFVGDRPIATIDYRDGRKETCTRRNTGQGNPVTFADVPLVVLVNGETLGGGELVAAAIQDARRGAVVGQRTVGKGSVQNSLLNEQGAEFSPVANLTIRLSIGVFTRSNGKNLQRFATSKPGDDWGVRPDRGLEFAVSRELSQKLRDLWLLQSLRPGDSGETLPMDDPANDAQRQFAVKVLRKMLKKKAAR
jgi:C-terminal peptidase prc